MLTVHFHPGENRLSVEGWPLSTKVGCISACRRRAVVGGETKLVRVIKVKLLFFRRVITTGGPASSKLRETVSVCLGPLKRFWPQSKKALEDGPWGTNLEKYTCVYYT